MLKLIKQSDLFIGNQRRIDLACNATFSGTIGFTHIGDALVKSYDDVIVIKSGDYYISLVDIEHFSTLSEIMVNKNGKFDNLRMKALSENAQYEMRFGQSAIDLDSLKPFNPIEAANKARFFTNMPLVDKFAHDYQEESKLIDYFYANEGKKYISFDKVKKLSNKIAKHYDKPFQN